MEISTITVCVLGIGATLKYAYKVLVKKNFKNIGAFLSTLYITIVYAFLSTNWFPYHGGTFVTIGVVVLFSDKILVFAYDLLEEIMAEKPNIPKTGGEDENGK